MAAPTVTTEVPGATAVTSTVAVEAPAATVTEAPPTVATPAEAELDGSAMGAQRSRPTRSVRVAREPGAR